MTIAKTAETSKLTKKAIRYYESLGLINPKILSNGYRDYSNEDVKQLSIIKTLRDLSFSINEIRSCLENENTLASCFKSKSVQLQEDKEQLSKIIVFLNNFTDQKRSLSDLTELKEEIDNQLECRPKKLAMLLQQVFPGDFGEILALTYGQFLNEPLTSVEQREAWESFVTELDELDPIKVPQDLLLWARKNNNEEGLENNFLKLKKEYNQSYEDFNKNKQDQINDYLEDSERVTKSYSNQDLVLFLAKEGGILVEVVGKYLPILSKQFQQFYSKQSKFMHDNPELIEKLKERY